MDMILHHHDWLDSTNDEVMRLARAGAPEGTVVVADAQRRGRGQAGRVWESPPGRNLYFSLLLRPAPEPAACTELTAVVGLALAEALETACRGVAGGAAVQVGLKAPNDLLLAGKKLGGILTEAVICEGRFVSVVVGCGINVNARPEDFSPALRSTATSLYMSTQVTWDRPTLLTTLLDRLTRVYAHYLAAGFAPLRTAYASRLVELRGAR
ncbi:MAG: biotin--[acetyl-CoA-carboxylase] ligase [Deltaproteobacteria bacterium]|nr:biotin--[acetyl-CoA-carboxylase] ligase [Deltaproteobacteria bacterium]